MTRFVKKIDKGYIVINSVIRGLTRANRQLFPPNTRTKDDSDSTGGGTTGARARGAGLGILGGRGLCSGWGRGLHN